MQIAAHDPHHAVEADLISSVAPAYTLTATIGLVVAAVALKTPAIFIAGCVLMCLTAFAYREFNQAARNAAPRSPGRSKAFGPYFGWLIGRGYIVATVIVLSSRSGVGVELFYLFVSMAALGIMICFSYASRRSPVHGTSARNSLRRWPKHSVQARLPCAGWSRISRRVRDLGAGRPYPPEYGGGVTVGGVNLGLMLAMGLLALCAVLMLIQRGKDPAFFRGETLRKNTPAVVIPE
jgi:hypothetical protein